MRRRLIWGLLFWSVISVCQMAAQTDAEGVLSPDETKHLAPDMYFFRGQSASVEVRNSGGFRLPGGRLVLFGLVDTGGYSTDVKAKYQGFLISEVKLGIEGKDLAPGQYGFGFSKEGRFVVMDVGATELWSVASHTDSVLPRPRPLIVIRQGSGYRLYAGRQWVALAPE
jgi:hypothetical protein